MERTTVYLEDNIKKSLLSLSAEESKRKGKRIGMAEMIRKAIMEYLKKRGVVVEEHRAIVDRMLSTRGRLGKDFEERVKEAREGFDRWKIESA